MTEIFARARSARHTKIIATLGPATDDPETLSGLLHAGVDAVRLNFSHGEADDARRRARAVRELAAGMKYHVALIGDLQGPKIRLGRLKDGPVCLAEDAEFVLSAALDRNAGDARRIGLSYPDLWRDVRPGDTLAVDDGRIDLRVVAIDGRDIKTVVTRGGPLSDHKGINRVGGGLSAPSITAKDEHDIALAAEIGVDYLAVSFPRDAGDMRRAGELLRATGSRAALIAKIERAEAYENINDILEACDAVMVARGDLSIEIGDAELTAVQKRLIRRARARNKVVITATEMMQSMIESTVPTRAEISDVSNAVLDGTDAVMLSAETAIGSNPVIAVEAMSRICHGAERSGADLVADCDPRDAFAHVDSAIAMAAMYTANHLKVAAIAALTESGSTALWMSRVRSRIPIFALTRHVETCRKVTLYRGVYPGDFDSRDKRHERVNAEAIAALRKTKAVRDGDFIIITKGDLMGERGGTNAMKVVRVSTP